MINLLLIALMGGVGSVTRYMVILGVNRYTGASPLATLCVNVTGSLLAGVMMALLSARVPLREEFRLALTVGFLGGFTTFSAFSAETFSLLREGRLGVAAAYVAASIVTCVLFVWFGYRLTSALLPA